MKDVLITGGSGLLGKKLKEFFPNSICPSHQELDITQPIKNNWEVDLIIHCAALKTTDCDANPISAMKTNIVGTANIVEYCDSINAKLVYISTDYVFKGNKGNYTPTDEVMPQNYYAETKLAGEYAVKSLPLNKYLIIRTSFSPDVYPYDSGFTDQWTTRLKVSEAAKKISDAIMKNKKGIIHIYGQRQTVYQFALSTSNGKPIAPIKLKDHAFNRPKDTTLSK